MKIAIVTPGFLPVSRTKGGAVERLITFIIDENEKEKNDISFDLYNIYDSNICNYKKTTVINIKISKIELLIEKILNKLYSLFNLKKHCNIYCNKVCKSIKKEEYDWILIENNMYNYKKIHKHINKKTKLIFHLHNDIGGRDKPSELCEYICNTASLILTCSDYLNKKIQKYSFRNIVFTIHNVIDLKRFKNDINARKEIREKYNLDEDKFVFGYIGRISKEKGVLELLNAFKKNQNHKKCYLMIIGSAWYNNSYKNQYSKQIRDIISQIKDNIIVVGEVDNNILYKYISCIDCVVIPTVCEEAFGIVALEAMACSKPLIISDSGGLQEVVNKECALIANRENLITSLSNNMDIILKDKKESYIMGKKGYEHVIQNKNYHYKNYYFRFLNIINNY